MFCARCLKEWTRDEVRNAVLVGLQLGVPIDVSERTCPHCDTEHHPIPGYKSHGWLAYVRSRPEAPIMRVAWDTEPTEWTGWGEVLSATCRHYTVNPVAIRIDHVKFWALVDPHHPGKVLVWGDEVRELDPGKVFRTVRGLLERAA